VPLLALDEPGSDLVPFPPHGGLAQFPLHGRYQPDQAVLGDEVVGSRPHGGRHDILGRRAGDDDEGHVRDAGPDDIQGHGGTEPGHDVIADDQIPRLVRDGVLHVLLGVHPPVGDVKAAPLELAEAQLDVVLVILDEEHPQRKGHTPPPPGAVAAMSLVPKGISICSRPQAWPFLSSRRVSWG